MDIYGYNLWLNGHKTWHMNHTIWGFGLMVPKQILLHKKYATRCLVGHLKKWGYCKRSGRNHRWFVHVCAISMDFPKITTIISRGLCALLGLARPSRSTHGFPALEKPRLRPRQDAHHWTGIHTFAARWELPSAPAARHAGREKGTTTTWALEYIYRIYWIYWTYMESLWYHVYVYIYIYIFDYIWTYWIAFNTNHYPTIIANRERPMY